MSRVYAVLAVVWTLLLAGILYELHGINQQAVTNRQSTYQFLSGAAKALNEPDAPETEAERKARIWARQQRLAKDMEYALSAPMPPSQSSRAPRRAGQPLDQSPTRDTRKAPDASR